MVDIFSKMDKEEQLTMFVVNDKIKHSSTIRILENCVCHHKLDSFLIFNEFSYEIIGDINNYKFVHYLVKCINIWKYV